MYDFIYKNDFIHKNVYEMGVREKNRKRMQKWIKTRKKFPEDKPDLP